MRRSHEDFGTDEAFESEARSGEMDLRALRAAIIRKKWWIIGPTIGVFLLVVVFVFLAKPRYTAEAQVLLENQENFLTRPERREGSSDGNGLVDPEAVGSQVQLVTSRDLARRAIKEVGLEGNPEFDPSAKGLGFISRILVLLGLARDPMRVSPEDRILETFQEKLTVFSPPKTRVLTIQYQSNDSELAAKIANEIAALYLKVQSDAKRGNAKAIAYSLATLIADLRVKLAQAEAETAGFRANSGLLAGMNNMTITGQQLGELNSELSKARTSQADAQAKAGLIREMIRQNRASEIPDVANNDLVRRIGEQRVTLRAQLALESRTLLPGHPRIKELNAQLANVETDLRAAADKTVHTLENDARIAGSRVANLETALSQQKKVAAVANTDEVHLHELERAAQGYRDQLESSTTKYQEALARENSQSTPADARIISRAIAPNEPSFPKKGPFIVFGTFAALILSLGTVVAGELLSGRAFIPAEITGEPPRALGDLPLFKAFGSSDKRERVQEAKQKRLQEPAQEAVEERGPPHWEAESDYFIASDMDAAADLAERIKPSAKTGKGTRIIATSASEAAAASGTIIALARCLSWEGRSIIVELDSKSQKLQILKRSGEPLVGLTELLAGEASFAEVIHRDHASRLHFVPFGRAGATNFHDLDLIMAALSETYDFILLAAPPFAQSEMAKALAPDADFVVLAALPQAGEEAARAYSSLIEAGAKDVLVIGVGGQEASADRSQFVA